MLISREKFAKIEEYILYLFGIAIFLTEPCIKAMCGVVIILLVLRKILFKEKLFCGNEKLTKFLIWFLIIGIFWNFLAGMSYKPARNFIKMMRYIVLMFYVYPIVQRDRGVLKKLYISCLIGFIMLFIVVFIQYKNGFYRAYGLVGIHIEKLGDIKNLFIEQNQQETLGINTTALCTSIFGVITISLMMLNEKFIYLFYTICQIAVVFFVVIATKSRSGLVTFIVVLSVLVGVTYIFYKKERKKIYLLLLCSSVILGLWIKNLPPDKIDRFKTILKLKNSDRDLSSNLRIEMLKIAKYRIKKHPILGSGTKYDKEYLFKKYVDNMNNVTDREKEYKNIFQKGFDDAHNIYVNTLVDNGLYIIGYLMIWFGIPFMIIKRLKYCEENDKIIAIAMLMGILSYEIQGLFWPIWRNMNQVLFWFILSIAVSVTISSKTENIEKNVLN